jgi:gas vesicle protein
MNNSNHKDGNHVTHVKSFLAGLLLGGLAGAVAMLLLAPRSGKKTRAHIQHQGMDLRAQAVERVEDAEGQVRAKAHQITDGIREGADELQQRGQTILDEQRERVSAVVEAAKTAVQAS